MLKRFLKPVYATQSGGGRRRSEEQAMLDRMPPEARSAYQQTARLRRNGATAFTIGGRQGRNLYGSGFRRENRRTRTL